MINIGSKTIGGAGLTNQNVLPGEVLTNIYGNESIQFFNSNELLVWP